MTIRKLSIIAACLVTTTSAYANDPLPPDLCSEPLRGATGEAYVDKHGQTISRFCDPRVDPPVLDAEVCCSVGEVATCKLPDAVGRCTSGMKFWCEYGAAVAGGIECYQDGPSSCAAGFCKPPGSFTGDESLFEDSSWICCTATDCIYVGESGDDPPPGAEDECEGSLTVCSWGATNEDGTVSCLG